MEIPVNDILLATREDAEEILDQLRGRISAHKVATVSDLYTLAGLVTTFADSDEGWTNLNGAEVRQDSHATWAYILVLPEPKPLSYVSEFVD